MGTLSFNFGPGWGIIPAILWGRSSIGRAPALQAGGRGFDTLQLHQDRKAVKKRDIRFDVTDMDGQVSCDGSAHIWIDSSDGRAGD